MVMAARRTGGRKVRVRQGVAPGRTEGQGWVSVVYRQMGAAARTGGQGEGSSRGGMGRRPGAVGLGLGLRLEQGLG